MPELPFKRVVIHGVGLLGASLGLALRRRGLAAEVVGLGRSAARLEEAHRIGALDSFTIEPADALRGADAYITCLPPRLIRESWAELSPLITPGTFVTDVGSVKSPLVAEAERILAPGVLFVGSHPMAGSEKSGAANARENLFENSTCFITPTEQTHPNALALATAFWRALGSRAAIISPSRHDTLAAQISHLPHLLAVSLVQQLFEHGDSTPYLRNVIGNGFRDSTRIAAGEAAVWEQIFTENGPALVGEIDRMIDRLKDWRAKLGAPLHAGENIQADLEQAGAYRRDLDPELVAQPIKPVGRRPRLLLTNDDGIRAPGLQALADALEPEFDLLIVAPSRERSGAGHGITVLRDLKLEHFERKDRHWGWSFDGKPADCVKVALATLSPEEPIDLVVSGINLGQNLGVNISYSGTVGAAREAAHLGLPSIAFSQTFRDISKVDFNLAARVALDLVRRVLANGIPPQTFLNVNIPQTTAELIRGYRITRQGDSGFPDHFRHLGGDAAAGGAVYRNVGIGFRPSSGGGLDLDDRAIRQKYVSVTPILVDTTAHGHRREFLSLTEGPMNLGPNPTE